MIISLNFKFLFAGGNRFFLVGKKTILPLFRCNFLFFSIEKDEFYHIS